MKPPHSARKDPSKKPKQYELTQSPLVFRVTLILAVVEQTDTARTHGSQATSVLVKFIKRYTTAAHGVEEAVPAGQRTRGVKYRAPFWKLRRNMVTTVSVGDHGVAVFCDS